MKVQRQNNSLTKLVAILNDGEFHDGTTLGDTLNITRSAVWKALKKLASYNIKIHSVKGKGYALAEPLILLNKSQIKKSLIDKSINLEVFESIASTNDYLKAFQNQPSLKFCLAETQTHGKGRLQRFWHSPFAQNIYLSCLYPFQRDVSELSGLSLVVALSIAETLNLYNLPYPAMVKWPNDILCHHQKIAGNLIELTAESNGATSAIIGIGINVNMLTATKAFIPQAWTSLRLMLGKYINRNELVALIINNLIANLNKFTKDGLKGFHAAWQQADYLANKEIHLQGLTNKSFGIMRGIDNKGHLLLTLKDGSVQAFSSGDTSITS